ncbi:hypothetical protein GCK72_006856 [Caenorhabditis remanei]|uniref:C2H2-type domain-containing protein n=1 Tax=Caenorhabditis remanei TaxID=31234 RepID=A0A6A5HGC8_CAERE|nr:hypothetical protein GCK72_006856 [Caenorhabditis remanei]KAF1766898.1 hypothetical protein GCK72_006856 [Caenorhabditis remanei]
MIKTTSRSSHTDMSSNQPVDVFDFQQNPIFCEIQPSIELFAEESSQKNENIPSSSNCSVVRYIDPRMIYKCNVCHKTFKEFKGLKQHAVVHTRDRPFKCNICSKHFRFKSNLFEHQSVHTAVTPYQCSYCGKAYRLKGNLKKHLRVHVTSKEELEAAYKPFAAKKSTKKYKEDQRRYWAEDCPTIFHENEQKEEQFTDFTEFYNCPACHIRLMSRAICIDHSNMDRPSNTDPFNFFCTKCFRRFDNEKSYKKHLEYHDYVLDFIKSPGFSV